jgi:hypothetical protein
MGLIMTGDYYMDYSPETLLYINPKYEKLITFMRTNHQLFQKCSVHHLVRTLGSRLDWLSQAKAIPFSKLFAPLIDFYYQSNNLEVKYELIRKAKESTKVKDVVLTDEENLELKTALEWVVQYCNANTYPIKEMLDFYIQLESLIQECEANN